MSSSDLLTPSISQARFTVLLGKNGAGKSTLLRSLSKLSTFSVKYVSPERGGTLKYNPQVDLNIATHQTWLRDTRDKNRFEQFREQSAAQFRTLEMMVLREIENEKRAELSYTFQSILDKINALLPAIKLVRADKGFAVRSNSDRLIDEEGMSSGEAELVALAIEVLVFSRATGTAKLLLLDEPDVHLHPDLQQKFIRFVESEAVEHDFRIVIATHSTAIISAFSADADLQILPISGTDQTEFSVFARSTVCQQILPIFGAHPLSSAFNQSAIVLVEGDDDRRVLDQAVRSSNGKYALSPCVVGTVDEMAEWENWLNKFLPVIYDTPKAYSLRDLDCSTQSHIDDVGVVKRIRLNCYAIENLLLTNECLAEHGFTPNTFLNELSRWLEHNSRHKFAPVMNELLSHFQDRRVLKIKDLRNIIVAQLGSNKPWEVLLGQLIAKTTETCDDDAHSLRTYLGVKAVQELFASRR